MCIVLASMLAVRLWREHRINTFLDHVNVGDSIVCGSLEAYSCRKYGSAHGQFAARWAHQIVCAGKLTGLDKQLSKSLDVEVQNDTPTAELATSPVGPLSEPSSRKTLVYLILTLNQCFPDYDFSQLRARHFQKEESPTSVEPIIDSHLLQVSKVWELNPRYGSGKFLDALWASIDEACDLADCDVYSYRKDSNADVDPFSERSAIWSFTYFFYNRRLKRIVFFSCRSLPTLAVERAGTPGASSTPTVSQVTGDRVQRATVEPESDSEIVGGMDDV